MTATATADKPETGDEQEEEAAKFSCPGVIVKRKGEGGNEYGLELVPTAIKRGEYEDSLYPCPILNEDTQAFVFEWLGYDVVRQVVIAFLRKVCQDAAFESVDKATGEFNLAKFVGFIQTLSVRGQTIGNLKDLIADLSQKGMDLDMERPENLAKYKALRDEIKAANLALKEKEALSASKREIKAALKLQAA